MKIKPVCPFSFGANTYLLISGTHALAVDPSTSVDAILSAASEFGATLDGILLTHGHFDHVISLDTLRSAVNIPAYIHECDAEMLTNGEKNASALFFGMPRTWKSAEITLGGGDTVTLGDEQIRVIHTPGHTPGSVCYDCGNFLLTGDTLFSNSIGRCDLPGGDESLMRQSLALLRRFPPSTTIYAGHGEPARLSDALDNAAYYI